MEGWMLKAFVLQRAIKMCKLYLNHVLACARAWTDDQDQKSRWHPKNIFLFMHPKNISVKCLCKGVCENEKSCILFQFNFNFKSLFNLQLSNTQGIHLKLERLYYTVINVQKFQHGILCQCLLDFGTMFTIHITLK